MIRRVLIVDDAETNRIILKKILTGDQCQVLEAADGREALALLREMPDGISAVLLDLAMPDIDGCEVLRQMHADPALSSIPVIVTTGSTDAYTEVNALSLGANDYITKPYNPEIIRHRLWNTIRLRETAAIANQVKLDELTGLYSRKGFFEAAAEMIAAKEPGYYVMACFDVDSFKVSNDQYGAHKGDELLRMLADIFRSVIEPAGGVCCRIMADNFAMLYPRSFLPSRELRRAMRRASALDGSIQPITFSIGLYIVDDPGLSVSAMYDRAVMAMSSIKGRYDGNVALYNESMRERLIREQRIVTEMNEALRSGQFEAWFQPQYNHSTGALVGAEALARWRHPKSGLLVPPGEFIPVFERNGFIYELDKCVWEQSCALLRKWQDQGRAPLPISVNISRYDVFREDFYEVITGLVTKYAVPVELLRLEITESAFVKSTQQIVSVVKKLMEFGFTVEIDDFGSGYSSLNTLKDVPAAILKLDMKFLESTGDSRRGGNIVDSIVRMARWLGMSVIAEGVETREQADYLRSIGCYYVQGYLYARPMPAIEYEALLDSAFRERELVTLETAPMLDNDAFWDPASQETLIFNSYVGGACIFEYHQGSMELLRVNQKYVQELFGRDVPQTDALGLRLEDHMDAQSMALVQENIRRAMDTNAESACEVRLDGLTADGQASYLRITVRPIARAGDHYLFYCAVINVTAQRTAELERRKAAGQMQAILDNVFSGVVAAAVQGEDARFFFSNDRYYQILGYTREEYAARFPNGFGPISPKDKDWVLERVRQLLDSAQPGILEYRADHPDGRELWLRQSLTIVNIPGIQGPVMLSVLADVTQQRLAAERLKEMNQKIQRDSALLKTIMDDMPGGFCRMRVHGAGEVELLYANEGFCKLVALPQEEIYARYGKDLLAGMHPDDVPAARRAYAEMAASGQIQLTCRLASANGGYISTMVFARPVQDEQGQTYLNAFYTNLSQQMQQDQQRRELLENLPCGAGLYRLDGGGVQTVSINRRCRQLLGSTLDEQREAVHPDDRGIFMQTLRSALNSRGQGGCDIRIRDGSGGYVPFHLEGGSIGQNGDPNMVCVAYTPIGKEEQSFRETLASVLQAIMEFSMELCFAKDRDFRYICCSPAFANMAGCQSQSQVVGKTDYDLFGKDIADKFRSDDIRLIQSGQSIVNMVELIPAEDDIPHYSSTSKYLLTDTAGNIVGLYGTGRDITEYRSAFERLKLMTNSIPGGLAMYEASPKSVRLLYCSDGYFIHTGYTKQEYLAAAKDDPLALILKEDLPRVAQSIQSAVEGASAFGFEYRARCKDGGSRWLDVQGVVVERHGDTVIANVVKLDITQRKLAEEKLRTREEEYRLAIANSRNLIYRYSHEDNAIDVPEDTAKLLGLASRMENMPQSVLDAGLVAPESVSAYARFFQAIRRGEKTGDMIIRRKISDGSCRWFRVRFSNIFGDEGKPVSAIVMLLDITQEHEKELAYERYLQTIHGEELKDGLVYFEADLTDDQVEKSGGSISGAAFPGQGSSFTELIHAGLKLLIPGEEKDWARSKLAQARWLEALGQIPQPQARDWPVMLEDGRERWLRTELQLIQDRYSGHRKAYITVKDVTHQKLAALDVQRQAEQDGMTGLYNKTTAETLIQQSLDRGEGRPCALILFDLDNLKSINDALGHDRGDEAIRSIARTLRGQFRRSDVVGRVGGDEFVVYMDGVGGEAKLRSVLHTLMGKLSALRVGPGMGIPVSGSIGVAAGVTGREDYIGLFRKADKALYHVKRNGKNDFAFYTPDMERTSYVYQGHEEAPLWQEGSFDKGEMEHLLKAVSAVYPLVISANLTKNSYYTMRCDAIVPRSCVNSGIFDELIARGAETCHPDDRTSFRDAFSRENLLKAYARGERMVSHEGRQLGDDGIYRRIHTDAVFVKSKAGEDVLEITLARECG